RFEAAARAFGFSERGRGSLDSPRHASESGPYDEALNAVREALGGRFEPLFWRGAEDDFETACRRVDDALSEQTL
ncbi:MAG TPA: hypothetical protein VFN49_00325, partial [Candidatus Aquilonibacter sp.]|nr:hypothetical protein [Candidatus Aquilonibacter sp.]